MMPFSSAGIGGPTVDPNLTLDLTGEGCPFVELELRVDINAPVDHDVVGGHNFPSDPDFTISEDPDVTISDDPDMTVSDVKDEDQVAVEHDTFHPGEEYEQFEQYTQGIDYCIDGYDQTPHTQEQPANLPEARDDVYGTFSRPIDVPNQPLGREFPGHLAHDEHMALGGDLDVCLPTFYLQEDETDQVTEEYGKLPLGFTRDPAENAIHEVDLFPTLTQDPKAAPPNEHWTTAFNFFHNGGGEGYPYHEYMHLDEPLNLEAEPEQGRQTLRVTDRSYRCMLYCDENGENIIDWYGAVAEPGHPLWPLLDKLPFLMPHPELGHDGEKVVVHKYDDAAEGFRYLLRAVEGGAWVDYEGFPVVENDALWIVNAEQTTDTSE
ncbi:hypothetical protein N3K66_002943 [Trichothecium roseum]|uniref:Uncharacterized protein n=1 Tax=Trichothecium roseum TaxID=47278 RepID=A0ACC0V405_9HYPO|nr:hypothetical protein N3K66_002943 [Trichothecium roseum]